MDLTVERLACRRAGRLVFANLSFSVAAGKPAVLRGPNGSGKSSLLRVLAGLLAPPAGTARMDGIALSDGEDWREKVALAGHLDAVKPAMTVRENLTSWAAFHGRPEAVVDAALERFELSALRDDPAHWCSAGQKRRLGLARLLVVDRPLWLLDEPTVSLDVHSTRVFAAAVREHCAAGGLALAATHVDLGFGADAPVIAMEQAQAEEVDAPPPKAVEDPFLTGGWT